MSILYKFKFDSESNINIRMAGKGPTVCNQTTANYCHGVEAHTVYVYGTSGCVSKNDKAALHLHALNWVVKSEGLHLTCPHTFC